ncbi:MAG: efflux RND transporter periplasmic adaptor subunit [Burkholderiaceae bacterium]|nr:efflux RND transporter periplasmic adaptor subunit [Burkholderiaceae bacterium]
MNRAFPAVLAVLAVAAAAGGGYWFGTRGTGAQGDAPPQVAQAPRKNPAGAGGAANEEATVVEVARVVSVALPQTITAVGSLRSDESVTLRPEIAGRITEILFQEGREVQKGDLLVRLDQSITQAEVRQARANLTLAKGKYERSVDLARRNFISGQAKDEARNNLEIAASALALAEARLRKTEIRAPFSGIIGLRSVSTGDYVREGQDMVTLQAIDPLKVDFRVPEMFLTQVAMGQSVEVALDALPGKTYEGKVYALDPLVDAAGRSIVIRAQVGNQGTALRPGMFARVMLITSEQKEALVVPEQALIPQGTDQYVFRVVHSRAERVKVATGQRRDGKVEIQSGLEGGDIVVTAGQLKLRDGVLVRAANAGANGNPAATDPASGSPGPARSLASRATSLATE